MVFCTRKDTMNTLKSLLKPISQLSFDLRSNNVLKAYNAMQIVNKITGLELNWKSLPHSQLLNVIANQIGYYSKDGKTPWNRYIEKLALAFNSINDAYQMLNPISLDWLENEDCSSFRWYIYLKRNDVDFKNRVELLKKYLEIRYIDFNRFKLNEIDFIGAKFCLPLTSEEFGGPGDLYEKIKKRNEKTFFKASMGWLYFYESRLQYCNFLSCCFRNAIFHNVDFKYSIFSTRELKGDIMGADFSFCNNEGSFFSYCYAREAKFYKSKINYAMFDCANLIGALFLNSSLRNASFMGADIQNVSFRGCNLQGADFTGAYVNNVDCRGADLRAVKGLDLRLIHIDQFTLL